MPSSEKSSGSTYSALKDIHWSNDTDYMFHRKPDEISNTHYTIVIGRLLREKLLIAVESQLGRKLVPKGSSGLIDPLKSENHAYVWRFSQGYPEFPEKGISTWTLDQIKECNDALGKGLFSAVDVNDLESKATKRPRYSSRTPRAIQTPSTPEMQVESPAPDTPPSSARSHLNADRRFAGDEHGLDDLVTAVTERNTQWKAMHLRLRESELREQALRATNTDQAARIAELDKTIAKQANAASDAVGGPNILEELVRIKAENQELKDVIRTQKEQMREAGWLRERNRILERQLNEKTAEIESTDRTQSTSKIQVGTPVSERPTSTLKRRRERELR